MAREQASLYIDDAAIYVLLSRGRQVVKWGSISLEPGLVAEGLIRDEDAVAAKLTALWQSQGIGAKKVIAGISGISYLSHVITIPELPPEMLPEAVTREASTALAVSGEEVYISWQIISSVPGEITVYVSALPRNSVDVLVATLRKAGLDPYLADVKPLAIARAATEPVAIMVDIQPAGFDIVILADGMPEVVRSLPLPPEVPLEENLPTIIEELDRSVIFYNSAHMEKPLDITVPISVSGELAEREDIWEQISGRQNRPVQVMPSPVEVAEGFPLTRYITNIGLALKAVLASEKGAIAYSRIDFNALPEVYRPKARKLADILLVPTIVAGLAVVAIIAFFTVTVSVQNSGIRNELELKKQQMIAEHVTAQDVVALSGEVTSVEVIRDAFAADLDAFLANRDKVNGDLWKANACLPGEAVLYKMTLTVKDTKGAKGEALTEYTLVLDAYTSNEELIMRYGDDLRASGRFDLVVITKVEGAPRDYEYQITVTKVM